MHLFVPRAGDTIVEVKGQLAAAGSLLPPSASPHLTRVRVCSRPSLTKPSHWPTLPFFITQSVSPCWPVVTFPRAHQTLALTESVLL